MVKLLFQFLLFVLLTIATQVGGVVLLISLVVSSKIKKDFRFKKTIFFFALYLLFTVVVVPFVAPIFGREKVSRNNHIRPTNYATVLLNRNYVRPELNDLLESVSAKLMGENIALRYLDANFPFMDGFPLLPHLSHDDGQKIDISFIYSEPGKSADCRKKKSISGYGVFEGPTSKEHDQIKKCKSSGYWQYDYAQYFTFGRINDELEFSKVLNSKMIKVILKEKDLGKLFIEPHLKNRLRLKNSKVRYHGCRAVRHDDHIHVEL